MKAGWYPEYMHPITATASYPPPPPPPPPSPAARMHQGMVLSDDDTRIDETTLRVGFAKGCCGNADRAVGVLGRRFWPSTTGIEYLATARNSDFHMVLPTGINYQH